MMPASFGRRPGKKASTASASRSASTSTAGAAKDVDKGLSSTVLGKRPAAATEEEDDGLTAEERAANLEAERQAAERRARGLDSDSDDDDSDDDSDDDIGPPAPPPASSSAPPIPPHTLPPTSSTTLFAGTHTKTLSALTVDASGSRFALGSYDHTLSLYDFGGLTSTLKPFRLFEPVENYPVLDLSFSPSGGTLLVVNGTSQASLYTRDGAELGRCKAGDPYLRDMRNTTGHVGALTCGAWAGERFVTGGSDSTVRIWDADTMQRGQDGMVVLKSKQRGGRTKVTALAVHEEQLWVSGLDGELGMWDLRGNLNGKPRAGVSAHEVGSWTSSIAVSGGKVVTRGGDGTVKLWDTRSIRAPLVTRNGLENGSPHTSVIFDPFDARTVVTCISTEKAMGGEIVTLDSLNLETVSSVRTASQPIRLHWSAPTDQLFATHRDGSLSLYYDSSRSRNGILLALARPSSTTSSFYASTNFDGVDSYPIEMGENIGQSESAKRRRLAKDRADPTKTRMPQAPMEGRGRGGRIGAGEMQGTVQSIWAPPEDLGVDPREALLKYAAKEGEGEFDKAWKKTQPKKVFSQYEEGE
ncbi:WD40 repeat [Kalmanozyma brasiliensis GHG001]|nr:WD40 repeat [Kalmanozyma brasiliensis GHG001]EST05989.2 WD40 repeat [Kalmanozyma brasiliensis GHG001]